MWWGRICIDLINPPLFLCTKVHGCTKQYICFALVFQVCILGFLSGWLQPLSSHVKVSHCRVNLFFKMILDEVFCEAWIVLQETLFDYIEEDCCCWAGKICMKVLWQFWFSCPGHNFLSTSSDCCVSRGTSNIPVCLFLVTFIISCPLFWTDISCLYSVMLHP